eukprot:1160981-Pelagomonas_calceolata.AAC.1
MNEQREDAAFMCTQGITRANYALLASVLTSMSSSKTVQCAEHYAHPGLTHVYIRIVSTPPFELHQLVHSTIAH